jgi:hypothetical protein
MQQVCINIDNYDALFEYSVSCLIFFAVDFPVYICTVFVFNTIIIINATGTKFMRSQQKIEYVNGVLPIGESNNGNELTCILRVFDSFNAFSDLTTSVVVNPVPTRRRALSIGKCLHYIGYGVIYV